MTRLLKENNGARWYRMNREKGMTLDEIAATEGNGLTRSMIAGAIYRYRQKNGIRTPAKVSARVRAGASVPLPPEKIKFAPTLTLPDFGAAIDRRTCLFISGDPKEKTDSYCGHPRAEINGRPLPYCEGHAAVCYAVARRERGEG